MVLFALFALAIAASPVFAEAQGMDAHAELRHRLDSIEVEKQVLKRQGRPIDELEAYAAGLRDTLSEMRGQMPAPSTGVFDGDGEGRPPEKKGFSFASVMEMLPLKPQGIFDWVIIGTGAVALVSALMLFVGIVSGGKKRREKRAEQASVVSRRMNLAPTDSHPVVHAPSLPPPRAGAGRININIDDTGPADHSPKANLQAMMEHLRQLSPSPAPPPPPAPPAQPPPARPEPPRKVNAPEPPPPPLFAEPAAQKPLPPPPTPPGAPPSFNDLVINAANNGLSVAEISKRYQISVDQVRLILRMAK